MLKIDKLRQKHYFMPLAVFLAAFVLAFLFYFTYEYLWVLQKEFQGDSLVKKQKYSEAISSYYKAHGSPYFFWIKKGLRQKMEEAKEDQISHSIYLQGIGFFDQEQYEEAQKILEKLKEGDPDYEIAQEKITECQGKLVELEQEKQNAISFTQNILNLSQQKNFQGLWEILDEPSQMIYGSSENYIAFFNAYHSAWESRTMTDFKIAKDKVSLVKTWKSPQETEYEKVYKIPVTQFLKDNTTYEYNQVVFKINDEWKTATGLTKTEYERLKAELKL